MGKILRVVDKGTLVLVSYLLVCTLFVLVWAGCAGRSTRYVKFEEIGVNGESTTLVIDNRLLPGEKAEGDNVAGIAVDASGAYAIQLGQQHSTDLTGAGAVEIERTKLYREFIGLIKDVMTQP